MTGFIKKLREKPTSVKRRILYISTIVITGSILILWFASLPYRFSDRNQNRSSTLKDDAKPFVLLKNSLSDTFNSVSDDIVPRTQNPQ
ncbi:hypothetical protein COB64_02640 [Candidatus Wolfebacteria bacterium]|nr:MAG: hypothetical protein COB64_02640 [Candidatus Wolfebacteria bacterium]